MYLLINIYIYLHITSFIFVNIFDLLNCLIYVFI